MKHDSVNSKIRWTQEELNIMEVMTSDGKTNSEISFILNRTPGAIAFKKSTMGYNDSSKIKSKKRIPIPVEAPKVKIKKNKITVPSPAPLDLPKISSVTTRDQAKKMSKAARQIARANGKRITMAMFFVEDL